jgi:hypothetical protein
VFYLFALEKPKPTLTSPQEEWVSVLQPLSHYIDDKARQYACGFMNGDLKIFDQSHGEMIKLKNLHAENVNAVLFFHNEATDAQALVSGSEHPGGDLIFSQVGKTV